jgi:lysophospholipase L1-like esterase
MTRGGPPSGAARIRIVALGDSTTAGTPGWRSPIEAPPDGEGDVTSQYAHWLMEAHPEWDVLNRGVNGERSDQIRGRFERDVVAAAPHAVVIVAGVNDIYQGLSASHVTAQLAWMYEEAVRASITVVAGSIIPYNTATPEQNARMREVNEWIRAYASNAGVHFADTRAAVARPDNLDLLADTSDDLHPTARGYRLMARAIQRALEAALDAPIDPRRL